MKCSTVRVYLLILGGLLLMACQVSVPVPTADLRPNIIIIMLDDMGYSDPGCYGGEIQTPNIDRLAANGIRFTQFYNAGRCCPTRASLLTGLYPHQAGIGRMTRDRGETYPGYRGFLGPNTVTLAEVLQESGYQTGMVGKWHVSLTPTLEEPEAQIQWLNHQGYADLDFGDRSTYPTHRGFERYYGNIWGVVNYFDPFSLVNGSEPIPTVPDDFYYTDAISDTAVSYIKHFSQQADPFFLYVAHCAPHWPLHALPEDIEKYQDTYQVGWDSIRAARFQRQLDLGLFDSVQVRMSEAVKKDYTWEEVAHPKWEASTMAAHAAMVDRVDQGIGRILQSLQKQGKMENTLIMVLSDNGASPERYKRPGFDRNSETRSGERVSYLEPHRPAGPETTYDYIGRDWANVANTPFRYWKAFTYEGGICTPFIAHWPAGIAQGGTVNHLPRHIVDIMATCLEIGDAAYPEQAEEGAIFPYQGESLMPAFQGKREEGDRALFFEHYQRKALRYGNWKLLAMPDSTWELYDLSIDRTEHVNLLSQYPEKVKELSRIWDSLAHVYQVFPLPH